MRVAINLLSQRAWPTGTARYALNIIRTLLDTNPGDEEYFVLVTPENRELFGELANRSRFLLCRVRSSKPSLRVLYEQVFLPVIVRKLRADLLFTPYIAVPLAASCPRVTTIHDLVFLDHPYREGTVRRIYLNRMVRWAAELSEAVLTVSKTTAEALVNRLGTDRGKIFLTPNAVDPVLLGLNSDNGEPVGKPFFLYVGNAEPGRNIGLLLRAYCRLLERKKAEYSLLLVGPRGPELGLLTRELESLGIAGEVDLVGPVSDARLASLYRRALGLVLPSREEGFGVPCLEAMAFRCPVLCSDIPVFRELYRDAALFFDPDDPRELAYLMERVAGDEATRNKMIEAGLDRCAQFSWEVSAGRVREAFRYALEERGGDLS